MSNSAKCLGEPLRQWSGSRRPTGQNGLTLVETLIAAAALLIVSLAVVPLFSRALLNNRSGYDSNEASYLVRSELEADLPVEISHSRFDFRNPDPDQSVQASSLGTGGEELLFTDLYWDHGALSPGAPTATPKPLCNIVVGGTPKTLAGSTDCVKLGDAGWITSDFASPTFARCENNSSASMNFRPASRPPLISKLNTAPQPFGLRRCPSA